MLSVFDLLTECLYSLRTFSYNKFNGNFSLLSDLGGGDEEARRLAKEESRKSPPIHYFIVLKPD